MAISIGDIVLFKRDVRYLTEDRIEIWEHGLVVDCFTDPEPFYREWTVLFDNELWYIPDDNKWIKEL